MLRVQDISFAYRKTLTLKSIDFQLEKGKHLCVIGESGCGKSTLLKAIYGLLDLANGKIFWKNHRVLGPAFNLVPGESYMKYLAQEFDLMPFITVKENIQKHLSRVHKQESQDRVEELLTVIDMTKYANTKVKLLSGGQKQRVALAQVLAKEPQLLLLDEPFNFIDNFQKNKLRRNVFAYLKTQKITCVFATHDSTDMLGFADRVLVMQQGKIVANHSPENLYQFPPDFYTASLFGEVNRLSATLVGGNKNEEILLYPEELNVQKNGIFQVSVEQIFYQGSHYLIKTKNTKPEEEVFFTHSKALKPKSIVQLDVAPELIAKRTYQKK